jgi:hypothetical protein
MMSALASTADLACALRMLWNASLRCFQNRIFGESALRQVPRFSRFFAASQPYLAGSEVA